MQIGSVGYIRIVPNPERAGPSRVLVTVFTALQAVSNVRSLVVTAAGSDEPTRQQPVRRLGGGRFVASGEPRCRPQTITVVSSRPRRHAVGGEFHLQVPSG